MSNLEKKEGGARKIMNFAFGKHVVNVMTNLVGENLGCTGFKIGNGSTEFNLNNLNIKLLKEYSPEFVDPKNWQPELSSSRVYLRNKCKKDDERKNASFEDLVLYQNMLESIREKIQFTFSVHSSPTESKVLYIPKIDDKKSRASGYKTFDLYDIVKTSNTPAIIQLYLLKDKSKRLTDFFDTEKWTHSGLAKDKFHNVDYLKHTETSDKIYIKTLIKLREQGIIFLDKLFKEAMGRKASRLGKYDGEKKGLPIEDGVVNLDGKSLTVSAVKNIKYKLSSIPVSQSSQSTPDSQSSQSTHDSQSTPDSQSSNKSKVSSKSKGDSLYNISLTSTSTNESNECITKLQNEGYTVTKTGGKSKKNRNGGKRKTSKRRTSKK